jgi:hypothetical protein
VKLIQIFQSWKNLCSELLTLNISEYASHEYKLVPNPESYTNDNDIFSYQCLTNGCDKIISIKGSSISNLGTHFDSQKNHTLDLTDLDIINSINPYLAPILT